MLKSGSDFHMEVVYQRKKLTKAMKILYTNLLYTITQGIRSKLSKLELIAGKLDPNVRLLTESWYNSTTAEASLSLLNYSLGTELRKDRTDMRQEVGDGLLIFPKQLKTLPVDN